MQWASTFLKEKKWQCLDFSVRSCQEMVKDQPPNLWGHSDPQKMNNNIRHRGSQLVGARPRGGYKTAVARVSERSKLKATCTAKALVTSGWGWTSSKRTQSRLRG